jgi:hypothetical protein
VTRCQRFLAAPVGGPADRPEQRRVGRTYLGSSHARSQRAAADKVGSCDVARVGDCGKRIGPVAAHAYSAPRTE